MRRCHLIGKLGLAGGLAGLLLVSTGCSGFQETLGLTQDPPDEFRVIARAPLAIPPEFTLRPPRPGLARPQEGTAIQQARTVVFRATDTQSGSIVGEGRTQGEQALLRAAGSGGADPDIRQLIDRESQRITEDDGYFYDFLVFWRDDEAPGRLVDPDAEAKRLRENAALGRPVTEGETPTIERKKKALFEGIF